MRQSLSFELLRSGQLTLEEMGLMAYIYSYSEECCVPLELMAKETQSTRRTLARIIKRLEQKGLISKRYGFFKRLRLRLASLEAQKSLIGAGMIVKVLSKTKADRTKKLYQEPDVPKTPYHDRPNSPCYDRPKTPYSNTEENNKNKTPSEVNSNPSGNGEQLVKGEDWLKALRSTVAR